MKNKEYVKQAIEQALKSPLADKGRVVLITGPWGCGKTYLWKNEVEDKLRADYPKHLLVYASCFGIDSLEALKNQIFTKYLIEKGKQVLKKGTIKDNGRLWAEGSKMALKTILKGFQQFFGLDLIPLKPDPIHLIEEGTILCLDDLERKDDKLSIKSILGLVNIIAEQRRANIILIANDDQFNADEKEQYLGYKEKVVNKTIVLNNNIEELFDVLSLGKDFDENLKKSLSENKLNILNVFNKSEELNLRTLSKVVENLREIFALTQVELSSDYVKTLAAYTIEFSRGKLQGEPALYDFSESHTLNMGKKSDAPKDYRTIFYETYFLGGQSYKFSNCLHQYIFTGYLDIARFQNEFSPAENIIDPLEELLFFLKSASFFYQSEEEMELTLATIKGMLNNDQNSLSANYLFQLTIYLKKGYALLGKELDLETNQLIENKIIEQAKKDDQSFNDPLTLLHYNDYGEYFFDYYQIYKGILEQVSTKKKNDQLKEIITAVDLNSLFLFIDKKSKEFEMFLVFLIENDCASIFNKNPQWGHSLFELAINDLQKWTPVYIPNLPKLVIQINQKLIELSKNNVLDKMQKYRIDLLLKRMERL